MKGCTTIQGNIPVVDPIHPVLTEFICCGLNSSVVDRIHPVLTEFIRCGLNSSAVD